MPDLGVLIAIYGAVVATLLGVLELRRFQLSKPRPEIKVGRALHKMDVDHGVELASGEDELIEVNVTNTRIRPIQIVEAGLLLKPGDPLPLRTESSTLTDSGTLSCYCRVEDLRKEMLKRGPGARLVGAYAQDSTGRRHDRRVGKVDAAWLSERN